ncbi:uncharacterized protein [Clytia hemisphaerica]|uniref:uncharacterized protein n=1 Tax=Clytia hemisphaerica TaxID=252671 RepID=UPI0034D4BE53
MLIFGLCFFLYFLKLSGTVGFWKNLRNTDVELHQAAKYYQKILRKFRKAGHDIKFLNNCKQNNVYPKFVRWKNIKTKHPREREKYYHRLLNESLDKRHSELKVLRKQHNDSKNTLMSKTTWMKYKLILFSVNRLQDNICKTTKTRHEKKLDALIINKRVFDGIAPNPNSLITNLTDFELNEKEIEVLRLGLKHGILLRPNESEMIVIAEDIWNQINSKNALQDKHFTKHRVQTALKSFTYNYLDLDTKQFRSDQNLIKVVRELRKKCLILKPDKGQGIVLIKNNDYYSLLNGIFNDTSKFKFIDNDPTFSNL